MYVREYLVSQAGINMLKKQFHITTEFEDMAQVNKKKIASGKHAWDMPIDRNQLRRLFVRTRILL
jgi:hypothetical protein